MQCLWAGDENYRTAINFMKSHLVYNVLSFACIATGTFVIFHNDITAVVIKDNGSIWEIDQTTSLCFFRTKQHLFSPHALMPGLQNLVV